MCFLIYFSGGGKILIISFLYSWFNPNFLAIGQIIDMDNEEYPCLFRRKNCFDRIFYVNDIDVDLLKQQHLDPLLQNNDCGTTVPQRANSPSESRRGARRAG